MSTHERAKNGSVGTGEMREEKWESSGSECARSLLSILRCKIQQHKDERGLWEAYRRSAIIPSMPEPMASRTLFKLTNSAHFLSSPQS